MIKELLNTDLENLPIKGLYVQVIKKYLPKSSDNQSFQVLNYSILLIKAGSCNIQCNDVTHYVAKSDLVIIPKDSICRIWKADNSLQLYFISFTLEFVLRNALKEDLIDSFNYFIGNSSLKIALNEKEYLILSLIYKLFFIVYKESKKDNTEPELYNIGFKLFLYELRYIFLNYSAEPEQQLTRKQSLVVKFLTILSIHYKKQRETRFYAGSLFITPNHLYKIVKQVTGRTVKNIIVEALLTEAKNLLDNPELSMKDIAEELNFSTANSFSVFFKMHTSLSPSEYRSNSIEIFKHR